MLTQQFSGRSQGQVTQDHASSSMSSAHPHPHPQATTSSTLPSYRTEPQTSRRFVNSFPSNGASSSSRLGSTQQLVPVQSAQAQSQAQAQSHLSTMQVPPPGAKFGSMARSGAHVPQGAMSMPPTPSTAQQRTKRFVPSTPSVSGRFSGQRMAFTPLNQNQNR
jgi:hypothetical protein